MAIDVVDLNHFYASSLGQVARRVIRRKVRSLWGDVTGLNVLALGYATPFVRPFRDEAQRTVALMPAQQGVLRWPDDGPALAALIDETALPLKDSSFERILVVHGIEHAENVRQLMRELWRVLTPEGRLLIVVPGRRSYWAASERTPFGQGQPYSRGQITRLVQDCMFVPARPQGALYVPPLPWRFFLRSAMGWERVGATLFPATSGAILIEATKRVYAAIPTGRKKRVLVPAQAVPMAAAGSAACREPETELASRLIDPTPRTIMSDIQQS